MKLFNSLLSIIALAGVVNTNIKASEPIKVIAPGKPTRAVLLATMTLCEAVKENKPETVRYALQLKADPTLRIKGRPNANELAAEPTCTIETRNALKGINS